MIIQKNKRGITEVVTYALFIIIAIGLSIGVYIYIKNIIPPDRPECPADFHVQIEDVSCVTSFDASSTPIKSVLTLKLSNRGLFTIKAFYARVGNPESEVLPAINSNNELLSPTIGPYQELKPGETQEYVYEIQPVNLNIDKKVEVQLATYQKRNLYACSGTQTSQIFECT